MEQSSGCSVAGFTTYTVHVAATVGILQRVIMSLFIRSRTSVCEHACILENSSKIIKLTISLGYLGMTL